MEISLLELRRGEWFRFSAAGPMNLLYENSGSYITYLVFDGYFGRFSKEIMACRKALDVMVWKVKDVEIKEVK